MRKPNNSTNVNDSITYRIPDHHPRLSQNRVNVDIENRPRYCHASSPAYRTSKTDLLLSRVQPVHQTSISLIMGALLPHSAIQRHTYLEQYFFSYFQKKTPPFFRTFTRYSSNHQKIYKIPDLPNMLETPCTHPTR